MVDTYDICDLELLARDCLVRAGVEAPVATIVARDVALSEAAGVATGGFAGLLRDIRLIRYGRLLPDAVAVMERRTAAILAVDAGHGFGAAALVGALPELVTATRAGGLAMIHLTRASDPGAMAAAMADLAAEGLVALGMPGPEASSPVGTPMVARPPTGAAAGGMKVFVIRPGTELVIAMGGSAPSVAAALMALAPPVDDAPVGRPVAHTGWLAALDPVAAAAEGLLAHLPAPTSRDRRAGIALPPDLLAQIVNA